MLSLLRLERKHKSYSNPFRIRIFLFLSFSFGIEMINTPIHPVVPSKTIHDSRPKRAKRISVFRPKRPKNPTRWGGTYPYGLYTGVSPRRVLQCSNWYCWQKITREIRPGTSTGAFVVCEGFALDSLLDKADLALFFFLGERNWLQPPLVSSIA